MTSTIAIIGSRGIPNRYGGFEQFAEIVSAGLVTLGHSVTVYNASFHPYGEDEFNGVHIIKKWCPEHLIGSAAHFVYDYLSLRDALARKFDIILVLGYQSSAVSMRICRRRNSKIVTNMDGLEWKRDKWGRVTKLLTKWLEKEGAILSDHLVADNQGIQSYLMEKYGGESTMIAYGSHVFEHPNSTILENWGLDERKYFLLVARMEPENNIEMILDGYVASGSNTRFIVVGGADGKYGTWLRERYAESRIDFFGGVYDQDALDNLRFFSRIYFHGHSVGGTNPSLLEAMGAQALIAAHKNEFNVSVLGADAYFFTTHGEVAELINFQGSGNENEKVFRANNVAKIRSTYSWDSIIDQYHQLFVRISAI